MCTGVESTSEVTTSISSGGNCVTVCVPGRYRLVRFLHLVLYAL